jgi:GGDEF domain-containing protein
LLVFLDINDTFSYNDGNRLLKESHLIRDKLQKQLAQLNKYVDRGYTISLSMGFSEYLSDKQRNIDELISTADRRMYEEKKNKNNGI